MQSSFHMSYRYSMRVENLTGEIKNNVLYARVCTFNYMYLHLYERQINYMPPGDVRPNETGRTRNVDDFSPDFIKRAPTQSDRLVRVHRGICA